MSWEVVQPDDSSSRFVTYDCSLVSEECFIKPKKVMPIFLKTRNNNHNPTSKNILGMTLIFNSDRSTTLNPPSYKG